MGSGERFMKKTLTRFIGIFTAALILALSFGTDAQAYSEREGFWDFEQTVIKMDAGSTRDIRVISNYDYTYYVGPHTSAGTYMECTFKAGTDDVRLGVVDVHDCIEVYVQNINQTAAQGGQEYRAAVENLKKYAGNTNEFNAYYYYVNYADLQNAFGPDGDKLLEHYNVFGKNEKRIATRFK